MLWLKAAFQTGKALAKTNWALTPFLNYPCENPSARVSAHTTAPPLIVRGPHQENCPLIGYRRLQWTFINGERKPAD